MLAPLHSVPLHSQPVASTPRLPREGRNKLCVRGVPVGAEEETPFLFSSMKLRTLSSPALISAANKHSLQQHRIIHVALVGKLRHGAVDCLDWGDQGRKVLLELGLLLPLCSMRAHHSGCLVSAVLFLPGKIIFIDRGGFVQGLGQLLRP